MKSKITFLLGTAVYVMACSQTASFAQGTAFNYDGRLNVGSNTASGSFDLKFTLYFDASLLTTAAGPITNSAVGVTNGLFTTALDFGTNVFTGGARWLEIGVRSNGTGASFSILSPRQELKPAPYSIFAETAGTAGTASGVSSNSIPGSAIQNGVITSNKLAAGQVVKTLNGLTDSVNLTGGANVTLTTNGNVLQISSSGGATSGWALGGNGGTTSSSFLGTTDNQPLQIKVNGSRILRLEPNSFAPNLIGGAAGNFVAVGVEGATIAGGGTLTRFGGIYTNTVAANYGSIGGGTGNYIQTNAYESTIAGGNQNVIDIGAFRAAVGGGFLNHVTANTATIAGGESNTGNGDHSVIGGGAQNVANSLFTTVAGGQQNTASANSSTVGGGYSNVATNLFSVVAGGTFNVAAGADSAVGGGQANSATGTAATIPGGSGNTASGTGSFAAGVNANATHNNSFVWGDGSQAANSTGPKRFEVNAFGGINFYPGLSNVSIASPSALAFGATSRQMISLYDDGFYKYGIGVQTSTLYQRAGATGGFAWYSGGVHTNTQNDPGPGGTKLMSLDASGSLSLNNSLTASYVSANTSFNTAISGTAFGGKGVYGNATSAGLNFAGVWGENQANGGTAMVAKAFGTGSTGIYAYGTGNAGFFDGNIQVQGTATVGVLTITGGSDVAEPFKMSAGSLPNGAVVVIDDQNTGQLKLSDRAYDTRVAGIVSGANGINPGLSLHQAGVMEGSQNVALSGRVYVLANASNGAIDPGDLLTTSGIPGHAMKVTNHTKAQGAILGKAMSSLPSGKGFVLVLVTLQ